MGPIRKLGHIGLILVLLYWASDFGPSEERVKRTFTLSVGHETRTPVMGCESIIIWILFNNVSARIFLDQ